MILIPDPDAFSNTEEIKDSSTRKTKDTVCAEVRPKDVAGMIGILAINSN